MNRKMFLFAVLIAAVALLYFAQQFPATEGYFALGPVQTKFFFPTERLFLVGASGTNPSWVALEAETYARVNAERERQGLPDLIWSNNMWPAAIAHSKDMSERGYFDHYDPEGRWHADRLQNIGIDPSPSAENIAVVPNNGGMSNAQLSSTATSSWMGSTAGHREAILNPQWVYTTVGVWAVNGEYYFTQLFLD